MVIATTAATAGLAGVSSATKDGSIINTLLKVAFIVAVLAAVLVAFMWVTGEFSVSAVVDNIIDGLWARGKSVFMAYTPLGWVISAVSGVISIFTGGKLFSK